MNFRISDGNASGLPSLHCIPVRRLIIVGTVEDSERQKDGEREEQTEGSDITSDRNHAAEGWQGQINA